MQKETMVIIIFILAALIFFLKFLYSFHRPYSYTENHGVPEKVKFKNKLNLLSEVYSNSKKENSSL